MKFNLTFKITFTQMLKSLNIKKIKSFKTLYLITVSYNLKLTLLMF